MCEIASCRFGRKRAPARGEASALEFFPVITTQLTGANSWSSGESARGRKGWEEIQFPPTGIHSVAWRLLRTFFLLLRKAENECNLFDVSEPYLQASGNAVGSCMHPGCLSGPAAGAPLWRRFFLMHHLLLTLGLSAAKRTRTPHTRREHTPPQTPSQTTPLDPRFFTRKSTRGANIGRTLE